MKVKEILNDNVKSGANWTLALCKLSDGQLVKIFTPVMVGDSVQSEVKNGYTNWKVSNEISRKSDLESLINKYGESISSLELTVDKLEKRLTEMQKDIDKLQMDKLTKSEVDMSDAPDFLKG